MRLVISDTSIGIHAGFNWMRSSGVSSEGQRCYIYFDYYECEQFRNTFKNRYDGGELGLITSTKLSRSWALYSGLNVFGGDYYRLRNDVKHVSGTEWGIGIPIQIQWDPTGMITGILRLAGQEFLGEGPTPSFFTVRFGTQANIILSDTPLWTNKWDFVLGYDIWLGNNVSLNLGAQIGDRAKFRTGLTYLVSNPK